MNQPPRRRRLDDEPSGGGLPLFPLALVVILAGLLLGGALARFVGGSHGTPRAAATTVAVAQSSVPPQPTATPLPVPSATVTPATKPTVRPSPSPTITGSAAPSPSASPTSAATTTPKPTPTLAPKPALTPKVPGTPKPVRTVTPVPVAVTTRAPVRTPAPKAATPAAVANSDDRASAVVRSYLSALVRGDRGTASSFLAQGSPNEAFVGGDTQIESIRSASLGDARYKVTADVRTSGGEYYGTFTLEPGPDGLLIAEHYWIKPQ